jgi:hypothetical protein
MTVRGIWQIKLRIYDVELQTLQANPRRLQDEKTHLRSHVERYTELLEQ